MATCRCTEQVTRRRRSGIGSAASRRALALDPLEPGAYLNLAADKIYYEYDFAAANELLLQARKLASPPRRAHADGHGGVVLWRT